MLLAKKVAIVTGGAQGIGRATVERLAKEGAKVVVADVKDKEGNAVVAALKASGSEATYFHTDVSERLGVYNLIASARDAFGKVDILVNNAGTLDNVSFLELEEAEFDRVLRTNIKGAFLISQAVAKQMVRQCQADENCAPGAIINVTSINSRFGLPEHTAYAVSKGGLEQLTRSMAVALAPYGIRVNAVGPGAIETDMVAEVFSDEAARKQALSQTPLGRFGSPAEVASVIAWLASKEASYLTGTTVWADGGRLALSGRVAPPEPNE
ncbi:MAG: 3-oxoacyl-ACP reductase FabG [Hyphomicrobiaceae bacterium]|nr:3-oxoacyl-ACP reductase FabG [Hyphomicrobiaceae bacterium]MCC0010401.1 3-oxoacyl-ACP reductase FabG [Hyphomicrobiaceae bacterium]